MPDPNPSRRSFFALLTYITGAVAGVVTAIPLIGYFKGALRKNPPKWESLGPADAFPLNETRLKTFDNPLGQPWDGFTASTGVYVRYLGLKSNNEKDFVVFANNCTHLGCPVTWFPQSGLFMCPCHGGVYYEDGRHASGPPPRGLYHCVWKVENGNLFVQAPHLPTLQDTLDGKVGECGKRIPLA